MPTTTSYICISGLHSFIGVLLSLRANSLANRYDAGPFDRPFSESGTRRGSGPGDDVLDELCHDGVHVGEVGWGKTFGDSGDEALLCEPLGSLVKRSLIENGVETAGRGIVWVCEIESRNGWSYFEGADTGGLFASSWIYSRSSAPFHSCLFYILSTGPFLQGLTGLGVHPDVGKHKI